MNSLHGAVASVAEGAETGVDVDSVVDVDTVDEEDVLEAEEASVAGVGVEGVEEARGREGVESSALSSSKATISFSNAACRSPGAKRFTGMPFRLQRNFVKFHLTRDPSKPLGVFSLKKA